MYFKYKAIKEGVKEEGEREAADKLSLAHSLEEDGYFVIYIEERQKSAFGLSSFLNFLSRVSMHDKIIFARNLGAMIEAGLSMTKSLSVMERQSKNEKFKRMLRSLGAEVSQGKTLSETMKRYPTVFTPLFVSMVRAGEESGNLAQALKTVANQMEKSYLLTKKVRGAMIYPAVIFGIMIVIGVLMLIYVVPTLTATFKELNVNLPATTRFIITISDLLRNHYFLIAGTAAGAAFAFYRAVRTKAGKRLTDKLLIKLPIIGPMTKEINSARTARTLASLLSSGIDVVVSLNVTRDVLQNSYYKDVVDKAAKAIEQGKGISTVFAEREDLYPVFVSEMMSVGEETGKMGDMLTGIADFYEDEVDQKTKNMSTIIEPVIMVVIGAAVGFFAISMLAPTYSLVDAI